MAKLILNGDYMTEGERFAAERLGAELPPDWTIVTNKTLTTRNGVAREIDLIVIGANTVFVIDEKGFQGRIHGNDQYWVLDGGESCESPLNKMDVVARVLAGVLRDSVPQLQTHLGNKPFLTSAVLLSHPSSQVLIQEPRRDRIILLEDAPAALKKLDRANAGNGLRSLRNTIVEKLKLVAPRPSLPRKINQYTIVEEMPAGPYYRCFKATHGTRSPDEFYRVKLYDLKHRRESSIEGGRELINRDYRAIVRLASLGIATPIEIPFEWDDGDYVVVGQRIPKYPTIRAAVLGDVQLEFSDTLKVCQRMLESLARMHEAGVIHRNLTPDNTYYDAGAGGLVLFTDFDFSRIDSEASIAPSAYENVVESRYTAPEVAAGLGQATERSDIYSAGAILEELLLPHLDAELGDHWVQLREVIASMTATDPQARCSTAHKALEVITGLLAKPKSKTAGTSFQATPPAPQGGNKGGTLLGERYRIIRKLGEGAIAETYLVEDAEFDGVYVLKRIKDVALAKRLVDREFKTLRRLPEHPRIVKVIDAYPPPNDFHLKMEFVDGTSLNDLHQGRPWDTFQVRRLMEQLLEGLEFLERYGVAHRNISPRNVILNEHGPKLIGFGFDAAHDEVGESNVGTISFRAPELDRGEPWNRTCDLYAAGAIGLWLLLGRLPFLKDLDSGIAQARLDLPDEPDPVRAALMQTLARAVAQDKQERFGDAHSFLKELQASDAGILEIEEGQRVINPWVTQLQSLYRNSSVGNSDNRGLDTDFARATYVPTLLDKELLPLVLRGGYSVVLLSGNPGDGKTAFLEMVYEELQRREGFRLRRKDENGWEVDIQGHILQANYDASESHEGLRADELLEEIFEPFEGSSEPPLGLKRTVLVAINDGKMREFLLHKSRYSWLGRQVSWYVDDRRGEPPKRVVVVDLKQRSVVGAGSRTSQDLYEQVLDRLVSSEEWRACSGCVARSVCPIKFNRDSLAAAEGPRVRLRWLFQVSHLRRDRHITIRDMRSTLSYVIAGESTCEDIHREFHRGVPPADWTNRLYFSAAFNPQGVNEDNLQEFSLCDPAKSTHPRLERRLWHLHRTQRADEVDDWCTEIHGRSKEPTRLLNRLASVKEWMDLTKRRIYFEGAEATLTNDDLSLPTPSALLPYRHLKTFLDAVTGETDLAALLPRVCEGVSRANGVSDDSLRGRYLCVMTNHSVEQDLTVFKRFEVDQFQLRISPLRTSHVEKLPNALNLRHRGSGALLQINLDLFEILMRMNEGYLPGSEEMRPLLIDLDQFEARLMNEPATELLLLEAGRRLHRVQQQSGIISYLGIVGA